MKLGLFILWAMLSICPVLLLAQEIPTGVVSALKGGRVEQLAIYMGPQVELIMESRKVATNREVTVEKLTDFFANNKAREYSVNHQGKRDESGFIIGTLTTAGGLFRVNCFFKLSENQYIIHQIRIDKSND